MSNKENSFINNLLIVLGLGGISAAGAYLIWPKIAKAKPKNPEIPLDAGPVVPLAPKNKEKAEDAKKIEEALKEVEKKTGVPQPKVISVVEPPLPAPEPVAMSSGETITVEANRFPLQNGQRGDLVKRLQDKLNEMGAGLNPDGIYGSKTAAAVVNYAGLADGKVDFEDWETLFTTGLSNNKETILEDVADLHDDFTDGAVDVAAGIVKETARIVNPINQVKLGLKAAGAAAEGAAAFAKSLFSGLGAVQEGSATVLAINETDVTQINGTVHKVYPGTRLGFFVAHEGGRVLFSDVKYGKVGYASSKDVIVNI